MTLSPAIPGIVAAALQCDDRVKTAQLPDGRAEIHPNRGFRLLIAGLLLAASVPAFAMNPITAKADPTAATTTGASVQSALLPATTAIATPDVITAASIQDNTAKTPNTAAGISTVSRARTAIQNAFALLGTPYRWGGNSPDGGFDCSGLVGYVFRTIGIDLPRVSRSMAGQGTKVASRDALAEGDLVFFGRRGHVDHVGIYIGNGQFLHAPRTGRDVTVSSLTTGYWAQKYLEARRLATGS